MIMFTDPILQTLTEKYPPPVWTDRSALLFEDLIETVISQQLSGKAATSIFNRFKTLFGSSFPTPQQVLTMEEGSIRAIGVSTSKEAYIKNIARAFADKKITIEEIVKLSDEKVIEVLTQIKGIGKWSAEMILIFTLSRPDVFSAGDLGLRNAVKNLYGITDPKDIIALSENWKPNRSFACWYLWRSLENK